MARNISFALTTDQIRNRTKTVTRRLGWKFLKAGDVLNACVKCMGLKPGEKIERICQIRVVDVRQEALQALCDDRMYGRSESKKEGFLGMEGWQFALMFRENMKCDYATEVTRIEFKYID